MSARLWDADERGGGSGDGNRECEPGDPGEAVPDPLGQHDVGAPAGSGEGGEHEADCVDLAMPGLGEDDDAEQGEGRPDERPDTVAADRGNGQWAEELHGNNGPQRDALDRCEEG